MRRVRRLTGDTVQAINPFLALGIDEAASREEIDAAHSRLAMEWHPDRHASASPEEQAEAARRMSEINYAYELLTDPQAAAKHKATFDRVRAAGIHVEPAPRGEPARPTPQPEPTGEYRSVAHREFTVGPSSAGTPWTAGRSRGWFRRR
jgi:curved DNA-binding protein CbpA